MHRVELKVLGTHHFKLLGNGVPNAPCGVERLGYRELYSKPQEFLMHRVELKVVIKEVQNMLEHLFLMHRVELKDICGLGGNKSCSVSPSW